jgi:hypothetical protein
MAEQADAISLVNRNTKGRFVNVGDKIRIVIEEDGSAILSGYPLIKFGPTDYDIEAGEADMKLSDDDFDRLLTWRYYEPIEDSSV